MQRLGQGSHEQGFAETGNTFQQDMPAGNQGDECRLHNVVLSDDHFPDFRAERGKIDAKLVELILQQLFICHLGTLLRAG